MIFGRFQKRIDQLIAERTQLEKIGDALAHQLMYREHPALLEMWWNARKGKCNGCDDPEHQVAA